MGYIITSKNIKKYTCDSCDFTCCKKGDWNRHLSTLKHIEGYNMVTNGVTNDVITSITSNHKLETDEPITSITSNHKCECGNVYKHRQGLYRHRNKCYIYQSDNLTTHDNIKHMDNSIDKELLIKMLLKNQDVMEKMVEMIPNMGTNNSHNTNSHNTNNFNIQMFLNDHCKNAMNLTDFIHSLPITSETYDSTIENGLTKTITNMMVNGLNDLDILERPIHCTDASRKILYVKESDKWEKDNNMLHIMKGIKQLSLKQRTMINKWKDANEGWDKDDKLQSKMTNLVFNSMTQIEIDDKETNKIINSVSKSVYLDNDTKHNYTK